ncbi:hypothetical protein LP418_20725 [Nocardioides sp. B-3]|nr:hypothetical protein [Nocardioides sp. B-3]UUZ58558.1 hypothetical protein LP418_20725 [Nocardioides sp. B-3]
MAAPQTFHEPYLADNHKILELLEEGDLDGAEDALATYLDMAEAQLADAYAVGARLVSRLDEHRGVVRRRRP